MKDPAITDLLSALSGKDYYETQTTGNCMTCEHPNMEFSDDLSRKEYAISGMCQECQDGIFG